MVRGEERWVWKEKQTPTSRCKYNKKDERNDKESSKLKPPRHERPAQITGEKPCLLKATQSPQHNAKNILATPRHTDKCMNTRHGERTKIERRNQRTKKKESSNQDDVDIDAS
jgi:hypothetical protein